LIRPQRLSSRLTLYFVGVFALTFAVVIALTLFFANRALQSTIDDELRGVATTAEERIQQGNNEQAVLEDLSTAAQFLELLDASGNVVSVSRNMGAQRLPTFLEGSERRTDGLHTVKFRKSDVRTVRHALIARDELSGYMIVGAVIPPIDERLSDLAAVLIVATTIGLALAVGATVWGARREAAPFRELTDQAVATAASGFERPIPASERGSAEARDLRHALSTLVESQRQLLARERSFFADSSHVLRTPLAVLQGDIEMLEQGAYGKERQEIVAQARASIDAMSRTVSGLLILAREETTDPSAWEVIDLQELLGPVVAEARTASPSLDIRLEAEAQLEVAGDPHQLRDLFTSLLENSCRYTAGGGAVRIGVRSEDGRAAIEFCDTGIGFTEEELGRAVDRFFRGGRARAMFPAGSGLGLAIAARIVEAHHGTLELANGASGGAVVRVSLPLVM
jgi:signal transduction histidine kinase